MEENIMKKIKNLVIIMAGLTLASTTASFAEQNPTAPYIVNSKSPEAYVNYLWQTQEASSKKEKEKEDVYVEDDMSNEWVGIDYKTAYTKSHVTRPYGVFGKAEKRSADVMRLGNMKKGYDLIFTTKDSTTNDIFKRVVIGFGTNLSLRLGCEYPDMTLVNNTLAWGGKPAVGVVTRAYDNELYTLVVPSTTYVKGSYDSVFNQADAVYDDIVNTVFRESITPPVKFSVGSSVIKGVRGNTPNGVATVFLTDRLDIVAITAVPEDGPALEKSIPILAEAMRGVFYYEDDSWFGPRHRTPINGVKCGAKEFAYMSNVDSIHIWAPDLYAEKALYEEFEYAPDDIKKISNDGKLIDISNVYYEMDMSEVGNMNFFTNILGDI